MAEQSELQKHIEEINKRYEPRFAALEEKGQALGNEKPSTIGAILNIDFKVEWKNEDIIFDLPSLTVENQNLSLDLPEITSSNQNISFDVPDVRIVDRKVGQYPEYIFPDTIKWHDIIISVPETYMRRVDISFDVPSVTMRTRDFVIGIPKVTTEQQSWTVKLPHFTVIKVSAKMDEIKQEGEALKTEGEQLGSEMKAEIQAEVVKYTGSLIAGAFSTKNEVSNSFDTALTSVKNAIDSLAAQNCDPIKVPTENGDVNLRKIYEDLDASKTQSLSKIDDSLSVEQQP